MLIFLLLYIQTYRNSSLIFVLIFLTPWFFIKTLIRNSIRNPMITLLYVIHEYFAFDFNWKLLEVSTFSRLFFVLKQFLCDTTTNSSRTDLTNLTSGYQLIYIVVNYNNKIENILCHYQQAITHPSTHKLNTFLCNYFYDGWVSSVTRLNVGFTLCCYFWC